MAIPGGSTKTINDLIPDVIDALQGRTDVASLVPRYARRAIQEITANNSFEELRRTGPTVTLTVGTAIYSASLFLNSADDYSYPEVFTIFVDPPNNTTFDTLKYKTPIAITPLTSPATKGTPGWWSRFGPSFFFGPNPDNTYSVFLRYQVKHPFTPDVTSLGSSTLFLPDDWEEIVVYATAERIALVKRWNDQVDMIHKILWGDPAAGTSVDGTMARPGLVKARQLQVERDQKFNTRNLGIIVPRYTSR